MKTLVSDGVHHAVGIFFYSLVVEAPCVNLDGGFLVKTEEFAAGFLFELRLHDNVDAALFLGAEECLLLCFREMAVVVGRGVITLAILDERDKAEELFVDYGSFDTLGVGIIKVGCNVRVDVSATYAHDSASLLVGGGAAGK